ncbi:MAG: C40 family peptidase [Coriobacteriales bacterium]|nr:C40 family peptidase [Coriobacteriales bacterium]
MTSDTGMQAEASHTTAASKLLSRRGFVALAAAGLLGAAFDRMAGTAFGAKASDETLAALDSAQAEYEAAMIELQNIGYQLEMAQYNLSACEAQLEETKGEIIETEANIVQKQAELAEAQDILANRISANYRAGNESALQMILNATDFDDFISRIYYAGKINESDSEAIQTVKDIKADLEAEEAWLQEVKAEQEQLLAEQIVYTQQIADTQAYYFSYTAGLSDQVLALMAQAQAEYEASLAEEIAAAEAAAAAAAAEAAARGMQIVTTTETQYVETVNEETGEVETVPVEVEVQVEVPVDNPGGNSGGSTWNGGTGNHAGGVVGVAYGCLGIPYVWGGTTTAGFDCSGLTQYCYACCGYSISRTTYTQIAEIQALGNWVTDPSLLQPGDLVFPHEGHVMIYIGGGQVIHAPYPGEIVQIADMYGFWGGGSPI